MRFCKQKTVQKSEEELEELNPSSVLLHVCSPSSVGTLMQRQMKHTSCPERFSHLVREEKRDMRLRMQECIGCHGETKGDY